MNKEKALKVLFKEYHKVKMKGMVKEYAEQGIIEDEWKEITMWLDKLLKLLYTSLSPKTTEVKNESR